LTTTLAPGVTVNGAATPTETADNGSVMLTVGFAASDVPAASLGALEEIDSGDAGAAPIVTSRVLDAGPENAVIVAVPDRPSAIRRAVARPSFVSDSDGSIRPSVVLKLTTVPLCTGVPTPGSTVCWLPVVPVPPSISTAVISADPSIGRLLAAASSVIDVPDGAVSGMLSHAAAPKVVRQTIAARRQAARKLEEARVTMRDAKDSNVMQLAGQGNGDPVADRSGLDERGYIMVVLLVAMAAAAVWMSAALPSWRQQAQREKEAELVYRGEQYARAIALYMRKNNGTLPPNVDLLISQRYLRKKYKDPITDDDFQFIGGLMPGQSSATPPQSGIAGAPQNPGQSGISGVRSKSQAASIRTYFNQTTYAQWAFDGLGMMARMGMNPQQGRPGGQGPGIGGAPGARPGGPAGPGGAPGARPTGPGGGPAGPGRPGGGPVGAPPAGPVRPGGGGPPASGSGS